MEGLCWQVGNELSIDAYVDKWIPMQGAARSLDYNNATAKLTRVSDLIDFNIGQWNLSMLGHNIDDDTHEAILSIPLSCS